VLRNLPQEASGWQAPLFFPINRGGGLVQKYISNPLAMHFGYFGQKTRFS